jgi:hypothetical protein
MGMHTGAARRLTTLLAQCALGQQRVVFASYVAIEEQFDLNDMVIIREILFNTLQVCVRDLRGYERYGESGP